MERGPLAGITGRGHLAVREQVTDTVVAVREHDAMVDGQHAVQELDEPRLERLVPERSRELAQAREPLGRAEVALAQDLARRVRWRRQRSTPSATAARFVSRRASTAPSTSSTTAP